MSKKKRLSEAHEAIKNFHAKGDFRAGMFYLANVLKGRIRSIEWLKPSDNGRSEVAHVDFPDDSSVKVTRYILSSGRENLSIKVTN